MLLYHVDAFGDPSFRLMDDRVRLAGSAITVLRGELRV